MVAGLTSSATVTWLVASVDAARPGELAATAYRLFAIYENTGTGWRSSS